MSHLIYQGNLQPTSSMKSDNRELLEGYGALCYFSICTADVPRRHLLVDSEIVGSSPKLEGKIEFLGKVIEPLSDRPATGSVEASRMSFSMIL